MFCELDIYQKEIIRDCRQKMVLQMINRNQESGYQNSHISTINAEIKELDSKYNYFRL